MDYVVYVQNADGRPLMPTRRFGKVKRMLKSGKAVKVKSKPFTIRLTYQTTSYVQEVISGTDGGRTNIGDACILEDGTCVYRDHVVTRNKEIPKLMQSRKDHRQTSRSGERKARKRLAARHDTRMYEGECYRVLPGCEKPIHVKDIINSTCRFNHRVRPEGWLTPTANQLLRTLVNHEKQMQEILPVKKKVIEVNKFAFMKLEDPSVKGKDYCHGPMYGFRTQLEAIAAKQGGCLLCGAPIDELNHLCHASKGGSNTLANKAGLCKKCHQKIHLDAEEEAELLKENPGLKKKYAGTSIWNQVFPFYLAAMEKMYPGEVYLTNGWDTKNYREKHGIEKDHDLDAYAIACSILKDQKVIDAGGESYHVRQFRRQDRANIKAQKQRAYYLDGKKVAVNRKRATAQKEDTVSLEEWYQNLSEDIGEVQARKVLSRLKAKKSKRSYNNKKRIMPGAVFLYKGQVYVLGAQKNNGKKLKGIGMDTYVPASQCKVIKKNAGLVYI